MKKPKKKTKIKILVLIISFAVVFAVAYTGSILTTPAIKSGWYESIKPSITPPNQVFSVVWTILFFLMALSLYFAWTNAKTIKIKNQIAIVFGLNFFYNIAWSAVFFGIKDIALAFYDIILLWISIILLIMITLKISKKSAYLLIPYLLWVSFAIILNYLSIT